MSIQSRTPNAVEFLENRTLFSAVAGSPDVGFGNAGVLAAYQVLAAQKDGSLIASNASNKLVLLHPDGTLEGNYTGARPATILHQNVQSDGKYLVIKNGSLTRYNPNGTVDKTFGVNGTVSNFFVAQSGYSNQVYHIDEVAVDGTQIFVTGYETLRLAGGGNGAQLFVERLTAKGAIDATFGSHGIATPLPIDPLTVIGGSFFTEIGPDHDIYVASDIDSNPIVNRYSESGKYLGLLYHYGQTEGETVAGLGFQHDGKILVLTKGYSYGASLERFNADSSLDTTFGNGGEVLVAPPSTQAHPLVDNTPTTVFVRADGVIFASGGFLLDGLTPNPAPYSFAYYPGLRANPSAISGHIYNDVNNNGKQDTGESPLRYWAAYADLNNDSVWETGEPIAYTDYNGYYKIDGLSAGSYTLREVKQTGWAATQPPASAGNAYKITLAANQLVGLRDFGNHFTASTLGASKRFVQVSSTTGIDLNHPHPNPTLTQTASGISAFNGSQSESKTVPYLYLTNPNTYDTITVSGSATQKSVLTSTEMTDSGTVSAFENDNIATGPSFGKGESFFQQTFTVTAAVPYSLAALANATRGLIGYTAKLTFTGPGGAAVIPTQTSSAFDVPILSVNRSGVLAPGTYTITYDVVALDNDNNGPTASYSLDFKL